MQDVVVDFSGSHCNGYPAALPGGRLPILGSVTACASCRRLKCACLAARHKIKERSYCVDGRGWRCRAGGRAASRGYGRHCSAPEMWLGMRHTLAIALNVNVLGSPMPHGTSQVRGSQTGEASCTLCAASAGEVVLCEILRAWAKIALRLPEHRIVQFQSRVDGHLQGLGVVRHI